MNIREGEEDKEMQSQVSAMDVDEVSAFYEACIPRWN